MEYGDTSKLFLSIIIPAYREEDTLGDSYSTIVGYLKNKGYAYEILIVVDGSPDKTPDIAKDIASKDARVRVLVNEKNRGKGYSVRKGMLAASGEYLLFTDADLSTPIEEMDKLLPSLKGGYDVAIGSRALPGSRIKIHQPFYREYSGRVFNLIMRLVTFLDIKDTQCGFKCFTKKAAADVFKRQTLDGFTFDVEDLYIAKKLGYKIKEVPVVWMNSESSTVSFIKHSIQMFIDLLLIRLNDLKGRYS